MGFGDGLNLLGQDPRHVYPREGAYDVHLTVSNQYGSDTAYRTGSSTDSISPIVEQTSVVTEVPTVVKTVQQTTVAATKTKASMSPIVTVIGSAIGLLAITCAYRK